MKKIVIVTVIVVAAATAVAFYTGMFSSEPAAAAGQAQAGGAPAQGGGATAGRAGGGGGGRFGAAGPRAPMTVELGTSRRQSISEEVTVVGNLIGDATVAVVPRAAGRLQAIYVKLGDRVTRGQRIAKIEDFEIAEQVKQAEAAQQVSLATIRQREADLRRAETNVQRSRNLFERQLLPRQTLDDNEATYQAAVAQLDLARAQNSQSNARLDELRITLSNTNIVSPVNGFVARRAADAGAFAGQNAPIVDVVDITSVRLVANVVEKDLRQLQAGDTAIVEVDAYPGEKFTGRIARLSPVLDPATRTAPIEVEIPNPGFKLKPGMYARVGVTTDTRKDTLVVPANAVVDLGGRRGVFLPQNNMAVFRVLQIGSEQGDTIEVLGGIGEGERVITVGASALRDGDRIVLPGAGGGRRGGRGREGAAAAASGAGSPDVAAERGQSAAPGGAAPRPAGATDMPAAGSQGRQGGRRGTGERPAGGAQ